MAPKNVMIDIETMALTPDALVLSIGALEFTLGATPLTGKDFLAVPAFMEQIALCRRIDPGTQAWWAHKDRRAASTHWRDAAPATTYSLAGALQGLAGFVTGADTVWAKGPQFDIVILESLYRAAGIEIPWEYGRVRDVRTMLACTEEGRKVPPSAETTLLAHHPLADCRYQVNQLWEHGLELL